MAFSRQCCISEERKLADNFQRHRLVSGVTHRWKMCGDVWTNLPVSPLGVLVKRWWVHVPLKGWRTGSVRDWTVKVHAWLS